MATIYICEKCHNASTNHWQHADDFNSSAFCNICGSFCKKHTFTDSEDIKEVMEIHHQKHTEWLKNNGA